MSVELNPASMKQLCHLSFCIFIVIHLSACGKAESHLESIDDSNKKLSKRMSTLTDHVGSITESLQSMEESFALAINSLLVAESIDSAPAGVIDENSVPSIPGNWKNELRGTAKQLVRSHTLKSKDAVAIFQHVKISPEEAIAIWTAFDRAPQYLSTIKDAETISQDRSRVQVRYNFEFAVFADQYVTHYETIYDQNKKIYQLKYTVKDSGLFREAFGNIWFLPDEKNQGTFLINSGHADLFINVAALMQQQMKAQTQSMVRELERVKREEPSLLTQDILKLRQRLR